MIAGMDALDCHDSPHRFKAPSRMPSSQPMKKSAEETRRSNEGNRKHDLSAKTDQRACQTGAYRVVQLL